MKKYTESEFEKLMKNTSFNELYKKLKRTENKLDRRAKTIIKNEINTNTATTIS